MIELLTKLISIPSFVSKESGNNENKIGVFLIDYIRRFLPWMRIQTQPISNTRFNIIAGDRKNPRLVFLCHMDTVKPSKGTNSLRPIVNDRFISGLGAVDMKGGIAALLTATKENGPADGIMFAFDCDEEYGFIGIREIVKKYKFSPELVICPEPTDLKIINGCRGVIEISFSILGKTAHAGRPKEGINAIEKSVELIGLLKKELDAKTSSKKEHTTVNLSQLIGGKQFGKQIVLQANAVPDISSLVLDIRPAAVSLNAETVLNLIKVIAKKLEVIMINEKISLDYPPYRTERKFLNKFEAILNNSDLKPQYFDIAKGGFYEIAFLNKAWGCPAICFGPGPAKSAHTKDELVTIESLQKTKSIFKALLKNNS